MQPGLHPVHRKSPGQHTRSCYLRAMKWPQADLGGKSFRGRSSHDGEFPVLLFPPRSPQLGFRAVQIMELTTRGGGLSSIPPKNLPSVLKGARKGKLCRRTGVGEICTLPALFFSSFPSLRFTLLALPPAIGSYGCFQIKSDSFFIHFNT